jgi:ketosteroid isomerase-like protein
MPGVVETYLKAIVAHDWSGLADTLTEDVERVGPFFDVFQGREPYVEFISKLMPTLPNYSMDVTRVTYVDDGTRAYAELTETLDVGGESHATPEVLAFDIDIDKASGADRISRIDIFIKRKS